MRTLNLYACFGLFFVLSLGCGSNNSVAGNTPVEVSESEGEESESEGEQSLPICEDTDYSDPEFHDAFLTASEELARQGYEVIPLTWEDQENLIAEMIIALGCTPRGESSRRFGPGSCEVVTDLSTYQPDVAYCGGGARREPCGWRVIPDDCQNRNCWEHDKRVQALIEQQGPVCIWSDDTEECDAAFHLGSAACLALGQCGFFCRLIAAIALELDGIQESGKVQREECLYGTDPDADSDGYSRFADDDCNDGNGAINHGAPELCGNAIDDDCDGEVDEGFEEAGTTCIVGDGECTRLGILICGADRRTVICPATSGTPVDEICDGLDNDCDGEEDNGVLNACGECGSVPVEICDGDDNDCDGQADEDLCEGETACAPAVGACRDTGKFFYASGGSLHWFPANEIDGGSVLLSGSYKGDPTCSRDGERLAYTDRSSASGPLHLYIASSDGSDSVVYMAPVAPYDPAWSPDGSKIVFWGYTGECVFDSACPLSILDVATDTVTVVVTMEYKPRNPSFSPDGTRIVFGSDSQGRLYTVNVDGTELTEMEITNPAYQPFWSTGSETVLFYGFTEGCFWGMDGCTPHWFTIQSDGTGLSDRGEAGSQLAAWSPGGTRVATLYRSATDFVEVNIAETWTYDGGWYLPVDAEDADDTSGNIGHGSLSWCP